MAHPETINKLWEELPFFDEDDDFSDGKKGIENINELPIEILSKIFSFLPQKDVVGNRCVCSYWMDIIDNHYPVRVLINGRESKDDLRRKLELRIKHTGINGLNKHSRRIKFDQPQSMRSIKFGIKIHVKNLRRLLTQIRPNVKLLSINVNNFKKKFLSAPLTFPEIRRLKIYASENTFIDHNTELDFSSLFLSTFPSISDLDLQFTFSENWRNMDKIHHQLFVFLSKNLKKIKYLRVGIDFVNDEYEFKYPEPFELPKNVSSLIYSGQMQLESCHLFMESRYIPTWAPFIRTQKKLIYLELDCGDSESGVGVRGFPFHLILPGIVSSISTLRRISLNGILPLDPDSVTWIPLDCIVFRDARNLEELQLIIGDCQVRGSFDEEGNDAYQPQPNQDNNKIINLGEIPLASLTHLTITGFDDESGDLQTLVDKAIQLECLLLNGLYSTSKGVHGGIIQSFMNKPNKKYVFAYPLNFSDPLENAKFETVSILYPSDSSEYPECEPELTYMHQFE